MQRPDAVEILIHLRFHELPLNTDRDATSHRTHGIQGILAERFSRKCRHYADKLIADQQGIARERDQAFALGPFLIVHSWVANDSIRQMRLAFRRDESDLKLPDGDGFRAVTHIPKGMIESMTPLVTSRRGERRARSGNGVVGGEHIADRGVGA